MNIAVIGLGSMGKRRIRLLKDMYPKYNVVGVDMREDRRKEVFSLFSVICYEDLAHVDLTIDCVFVCTSPLSHNSIIRDSLNRKCHVFTELNLVADGYEENVALAKVFNLTLFLSSTFIYRDEIQYIRERVSQNDKWNYIYHIGQYLPDWHPWEDYKTIFLGDRKTNGCREILAIELPWLIGTFGNVMDIYSIGDKMTGIDVDYDDNFMIQLTHERGNKGILVVDVASPVPVRKLEVYRENKYLAWNGTPDSLVEYSPESNFAEKVNLSEKTEHIDGYSSFVVENAYRNEIKEFFEVVINGAKPLYGFEQDKKTLELIDRIGA